MNGPLLKIYKAQSDLEQVPWLELVPGVLQDVPQRQSQHRRVLHLLEVEQEGDLKAKNSIFTCKIT